MCGVRLLCCCRRRRSSASALDAATRTHTLDPPQHAHTHTHTHTPRNPYNLPTFNAGTADNPAGLIAYVADATSGATLLTTTECWTHSVTSVPGTTAAKPAARASDIYDYSASDGKPASGAY